ncbi:MAG: VOC family protein [Polyangia bacterium]
MRSFLDEKAAKDLKEDSVSTNKLERRIAAVLVGRVRPTAEELLELIRQVNPTGRGLHARFKSVTGSTTFSLHAVEARTGAPQSVLYFECAALDEKVAELRAQGFHFIQEPRDAPWLWREARLLDPAGNVLCLYHAGENRRSRNARMQPPA